MYVHGTVRRDDTLIQLPQRSTALRATIGFLRTADDMTDLIPVPGISLVIKAALRIAEMAEVCMRSVALTSYLNPDERIILGDRQCAGRLSLTVRAYCCARRSCV